MNEWVITFALVVSFVLVNLPWFSQGFLGVIVLKKPKSNALRFLELLLFILVSILLMVGLEYQFTGAVYPQDWEFYAVAFFIFLLFAFPGFIYRFIYRLR
jgi:hypothetical protein